jgi:hypothetical protein
VPDGVGYLDVDHVVLPVASLDAAVDELAAWGLRAAPVQHAVRRGGADDEPETEPVAGVRHVLFAPARADVANFLALVDPGPPSPVLVCSAPDLDRVRDEIQARGIDCGPPQDVEPRVWIDPRSGERFPVQARRLVMRGDVPHPVNGTQAGSLLGYHHRGWQQHGSGIRRIAGVTLASASPAWTAHWLSEAVFGCPAHRESSESLLVWPRDLFVRVTGDGDGVSAVTLLVDDVDAWDSPVLHADALPVPFELVDAATLAALPGAP